MRLLLVTSGDKGASDPATNPAGVAQRRDGEAGEAAGLALAEAFTVLRI